MTQNERFLFLWYLLFVNAAAIFITLYDKRAAKRNGWRIPESTLLMVGAFGGSPGMLLTMLLIRHKTQHKKFMIGLPVILAAQVLLLLLGIFFMTPVGSLFAP